MDRATHWMDQYFKWISIKTNTLILSVFSIPGLFKAFEKEERHRYECYPTGNWFQHVGFTGTQNIP